MRSPEINEEGELRGQLANPGSPGKMAVKTVCVCVFLFLSEHSEIMQMVCR